MTLRVTPSGRPCGARVTGVDLRDLDGDAVADIRAAWLTHRVLAFVDQQLTDDDLERFARRFGPPGDDPFFEPIDGHPHIAAIHRRADETSPVFAEVWHSDWSFQAQPPDGTCLYAKIIPPVGGDTHFVDQQSALAAMPTDLRRRIDGVVAIHSARGGYAPDGRYGSQAEGENRAMRIITDDRAYATRTHPLVRTHPETGAETLFSTLGYIIGIEGMADDDALALLGEVHAWQTRPEFQYHHRWEPDMLVMWDNRCVLHKATGGYDGHERLLHRITIGQGIAA
ncbi:MAG: TauD/TfdA dioxygenase family protein [Acidimicrobiales bacterium]